MPPVLISASLAHRHGAYVLATASTHNVEFVRGLGADEVIDYRTTPFDSVARNLDVILDPVGGDTLARSWGLLNPGGRLTTIASTAEQTNDPRVREAFFIVEPKRLQLAEIARLIQAGELKPITDTVFPLSEARQAYEHRPVRGKVVISVVPDHVA